MRDPIPSTSGEHRWPCDNLAVVRRLIPWALLSVLVLAVVAAGVAGRSSMPDTRTSEQTALVSPYDLTGLPLALARQVAKDAGLNLSVLRVPSPAPAGQVIGEDPNLQRDRTVVVSTGPLRHPFMVLAPATAPPEHAECAGGLVLYEDGNVGPLTCKGGGNVGAWEVLARTGGSPVVRLGRNPTQAQVITAICAGGRYTANQLDSVYHWPPRITDGVLESSFSSTMPTACTAGTAKATNRQRCFADRGVGAQGRSNREGEGGRAAGTSMESSWLARMQWASRGLCDRQVALRRVVWIHRVAHVDYLRNVLLQRCPERDSNPHAREGRGF